MDTPYFRGLEDGSDEPIKVFGEKVCWAFENIRQELNCGDTQGMLDDFNLNVLISKEKAQGPSCDSSFIYLHDVFLSYLWCHIYGLVVLTPMGGKELTKAEDNQARETLEHAHNLLSFHRTWDTEKIPNPGIVQETDQKKLVGVANALFWYAINYILYHELAHKVLGHIDKIEEMRSKKETPPKEVLDAFENEADLFALDKCMNHDMVEGTHHVQSVQMGVLSALSSIMFTSNRSHGGKSHPDPDHRIKYTLEEFNLEENDFVWGFATWIFITWEQYNNAWFKLWPVSNPNDTFKQKFYETLTLMEKVKNERK